MKKAMRPTRFKVASAKPKRAKRAVKGAQVLARTGDGVLIVKQSVKPKRFTRQQMAKAIADLNREKSAAKAPTAKAASAH